MWKATREPRLASLPVGSGNILYGSTSKLEVEALLAEKVVAAEAKASKLEEEAALLREGLNALQCQKVRRKGAMFIQVQASICVCTRVVCICEKSRSGWYALEKESCDYGSRWNV